jgi:hypothetical protein
MTHTSSVPVYIFSSTRYGHVVSGYSQGAWAVRRSRVGGVEHRADQAAGQPCLFYVSKGASGRGGFLCGPGIIAAPPTDEFARSHADLFSGGDWCLGFPIERLAPDLSRTMKEDAIRQLHVVKSGHGNFSQDLNLPGRLVFLPSFLSEDDCRAILAATGAFPNALERWKSVGTLRT